MPALVPGLGAQLVLRLTIISEIKPAVGQRAWSHPIASATAACHGINAATQHYRLVAHQHMLAPLMGSTEQMEPEPNFTSQQMPLHKEPAPTRDQPK